MNGDPEASSDTDEEWLGPGTFLEPTRLEARRCHCCKTTGEHRGHRRTHEFNRVAFKERGYGCRYNLSLKHESFCLATVV